MIKNTGMIDFRSCDGKWGSLVPLEQFKEIPFEIKRIYYIFEVPENIRRGFHSHNDLKQVLICLNGHVTIQVNTPFETEDIVLDSPKKGLYIGPMVWREMYDFSPGSVLLVLASEYYDENDYIRDQNKYMLEAKKYFEEGE